MRLDYVAGRRIPSRRANAVQIMTMCGGFVELGHEVTLYAREGDAPPDTIWQRYGMAPTFAIETIPDRLRPLQKLVGPFAAARAARRLPRAAVRFGRDPFWLLAMASEGVATIFEAHLVYAPLSAPGLALRRLFAHRAFRRLVCTTSTLADAYRRHYPMLEGRDVLVEPNPAVPLPAALPVEPWPGRAGAAQVGFAGQPFPGKGIETIAAAARRLGHVDFHVVGAERSDLGWMAEDRPANLHLHGYQPRARLGGYFARFDIAVAPYGARVMNASGKESAAVTSPLKVAEYLAAGLPVVTSDLPGVRDMLGDERVALTVPPDDVGAFVAAIDGLVADPTARMCLADAGRAHFERRMTATARARRVLEGIAAGG